MIAPLDITGQRYGQLIGIERVRDGDKHTKWRFRCDCGAETVTVLDFVRRGITKSCGCLSSRNSIGQRSLKHGHSAGGDNSRSRTLLAYRNAKQRCTNPKNRHFAQYGGRGIAMCEEWLAGFNAFLRDMGECPPGQTIERIDVNKGYEPGNCCWATKEAQTKNKQSSITVEVDGRKINLKDYAAEAGVNYQALHRRIRKLKEAPEAAVEWFRKRGRTSSASP